MNDLPANSAETPAPAPGEPESPQPAASPPRRPQDIDWLPGWYRAAVRRRRWTLVQAWATLALVVVLATIVVTRRDDEQARAERLQGIEQKRDQTDRLIARLEGEEARLASLAQLAATVEQIGLPLEASRVLSEIAAAMPNGVSLRELSVSVERAEQTGLPDRRRAGKAAEAPPADRFVSVRLIGLSSESSGSGFHRLTEDLRAVPYFRDVQTSGSRRVSVGEAEAWSFELTFTIPLELRAAGSLVATVADAGAAAQDPA